MSRRAEIHCSALKARFDARAQHRQTRAVPTHEAPTGRVRPTIIEAAERFAANAVRAVPLAKEA